ncbi:hypothetical protein L4D20_08900 [Vibrio kyushuensis]|uniref:hypothetical protein n=1 Tax=Vibrio kyushuensis TaxID=2910249 RepID=UPI003D0C3186
MMALQTPKLFTKIEEKLRSKDEDKKVSESESSKDNTKKQPHESGSPSSCCGSCS